MPFPSPQQLDTFADGIAEGLPVRPAAIRAGYSATSNSVYQWLKRPEFMARVEKFRRRRAPAATGDLEPVIERLLAAADSAAALNSAPALRAVRDLLAEAAKLKQLLPPPEATPPRAYEMTREAWLDAFAPRDPEPA
jgi:hypothetical protein